MTAEVITLNEDDNLNLARMEMTLARVRHLPVLREDRVVGLVTHRDILRAMCSVFADLDAPEQHDVLRQIPVREIMSSEVATVDPDVSAADAGRGFSRARSVAYRWWKKALVWWVSSPRPTSSTSPCSTSRRGRSRRDSRKGSTDRLLRASSLPGIRRSGG
jgi:hypothetical protein